MAIIPLANLVRRGTEELAKLTGPAIGGLLNVTFGNVAELVLAIFVLLAGHSEVVKAQITGSIIGNSLLGLGLAILIGSWKREHQTFKRERAGLLSSLLILSMVALLLPALFDLHGARHFRHAESWEVGRTVELERFRGAHSSLCREFALHPGHAPGRVRVRGGAR